MKYEFYCCVNEDVSVIAFLEKHKINYKTDTRMKCIFFTVYSDTENSDALLRYIKTLPGTSISKSSIFSNQEMEAANWYLIYVTRMGMETKNVVYTYEAKCHYATIYGMKKHYHLDQVNPFVSTKTPKWKNGYHFCSTETGFMTQIFCSTYAKNIILDSKINGVDFIPVVKKDLETEVHDVHQLVFSNKLPLEAYTFVGNYRERVCPFCGRINYIFEEPNCDNLRLNKDMIPGNIDAFGSEIVIGEGFGEEPIIISKKFYDLIFKVIKERKKHFIVYPII